MRHDQEDERRVNEVLLRFAKTHDVKLVATNNTYYLNKKKTPLCMIFCCVLKMGKWWRHQKVEDVDSGMACPMTTTILSLQTK